MATKEMADRHSWHRKNAEALHSHMKGGTANAKKYEPNPAWPMADSRNMRGADVPVQKDSKADEGMQKRGAVMGQSKIVTK